LGTLHAWQIAVKPGRPLAVGQIGDCIFFGLPGNPVAVFVTFLLYARPMLARLQGARWHEPRRFPLPAGFAMPKKKADRREFWRGWIEQEAGRPVLRKFARDGSALISGLRRAEGLIEVAEEVTEVSPGDTLSFIPFTEFGLPPR
jgi:molybdopterin molybdotransferase